MSGASVPLIARRITLKLAWPAALGASPDPVRARRSNPSGAGALGAAGRHPRYTSSIYRRSTSIRARSELAAAYAVTLLLITSLGIYAQSRLSTQGALSPLSPARASAPAPSDLGKWRYLTAAIFILYFVVIVLLPFWCCCGRRRRNSTARRHAALGRVSLVSYPRRARLSAIRTAVWNSLVLAVGSAAEPSCSSPPSSPGSSCAPRCPGRWLLDNVASLPLVFPRPGARARHHGLLSHDRHRHTARSGSCLSPMSRAFCPTACATARPRCCRSTRSSRNPRP